MRGRIGSGFYSAAIIALLLTSAPEYATHAASKAKPQKVAKLITQVIEKREKSVQLVTFPDTQWGPVKVVRGGSPAKAKDEPAPGAEKAEIADLVTFGDSQTRPVRVVRGETDRAAATPGRPQQTSTMMTQVVTFADPRDRPVSILRGAVSHNADTELFGPASIADLNRVAFAVDGAESSHGADLRMWRPEPNGPQGPMQITAAAASDVGGGNRFDLAENRSLGRAYLAHMYRRYGNWPDAIAAYNWGPGNIDAWIGGGRAADKVPLEVERYRDRVLREAALREPGATLSSNTWPFRTDPSPEKRAPAIAPVNAAALLGALQRAVSASEIVFHETLAAILGRAADWRSAYSALGDQIIAITEKRPRPENPEAEYAVSAGLAE